MGRLGHKPKFTICQVTADDNGLRAMFKEYPMEVIEDAESIGLRVTVGRYETQNLVIGTGVKGRAGRHPTKIIRGTHEDRSRGTRPWKAKTAEGNANDTPLY
jgi:hypothetical protein